MIAPALSSLLALAPFGATAPASPAATVAVEFVVDVSAAMTRPGPRIPMLLDKIEEVAALSDRRDLRIAVRVFGGAKPEGDCSDTALIQPFAPVDRLEFAGKVDPLRDFGAAPLARAIEEAGAELQREKASDRLLVIVTATPDACGANACAVVEKLVAAGLRHPRVIHVASDDGTPDGLACLGSQVHASTPGELAEAFAEALADAGTTTGIRVSHWTGAGSAEARTFSVRPLPGRQRDGLLTGTRAGRDVYALPHGTYEVTVDAPGAAPRRVHVSHGRITSVATGEGSVTVRALNFWGAELAAEVTLLPAGHVATSPASGNPPPRSRGRNTTMPLAPSSTEAEPATPPPAAEPATQPASAPMAPAATQASTEPAVVSAGVAGRSGTRIDLPSGRYDVVIRVAGSRLVARDVPVEAGGLAEVTVRLGGLRVEGSATRLAVHAADGSRAGSAWHGATAHLAPGRYTLRSPDGTRILVEDIEVKAGDVTLVAVE